MKVSRRKNRFPRWVTYVLVQHGPDINRVFVTKIGEIGSVSSETIRFVTSKKVKTCPSNP